MGFGDFFTIQNPYTEADTMRQAAAQAQAAVTGQPAPAVPPDPTPGIVGTAIRGYLNRLVGGAIGNYPGLDPVQPLDPTQLNPDQLGRYKQLTPLQQTLVTSAHPEAVLTLPPEVARAAFHTAKYGASRGFIFNQDSGEAKLGPAEHVLKPEDTLLSTAGGGAPPQVEYQTGPAPEIIARLNYELAQGQITPQQHAAQVAKLNSQPQVAVMNPDGTLTYANRSSAPGATAPPKGAGSNERQQTQALAALQQYQTFRSQPGMESTSPEDWGFITKNPTLARQAIVGDYLVRSGAVPTPDWYKADAGASGEAPAGAPLGAPASSAAPAAGAAPEEPALPQAKPAQVMDLGRRALAGGAAWAAVKTLAERKLGRALTPEETQSMQVGVPPAPAQPAQPAPARPRGKGNVSQAAPPRASAQQVANRLLAAGVSPEAVRLALQARGYNLAA